MSFDVFHPAWTRSKECFFDRVTFLRLIDHYEILGWGFHGVEVFSNEGQLLEVEFAFGHGAGWAKSLAERWSKEGVLFSPTLCPHQNKIFPVTPW
jgi:hypothetical protein